MNYYSIYKIDQHTWRIQDIFRCYMYLLEGENAAALIDTGMGLPGLAEAVKKLTDKPVFVINSHGHLDHVGGNGQFQNRFMMKADEEVFKEHTGGEFRKKHIKGFMQEFEMDLNEDEIERLTRAGKYVPYTPIENGQIFDLGNRRLEIIGTPGHTVGSICILDRERKELFSADTICDIGILLFFQHSAAVHTYQASIEKLKKRSGEFTKIWPGHHTCPIDLNYIDEYEACAKTILCNPQAGADIESNLGSGRIFYKDRISITYRMDNL